jgi:membrane-associated protease RseP (regulator of RpoE activity)
MGRFSRVGSWAAFALVVGCGAVYPELRTPVRPVSGSQELEGPPSDVYFVYFVGAVIPSKTRDGRELNPDPFARLLIDEVEAIVTPVEPRTRRPSWPQQRYANYRIAARQGVMVEVWDDNPLNDMPICREMIQNFAALASEGRHEIECHDSGARVTIAVEPAHPLFGMGLYYELRGSSGVFVTRVAGQSPAARAGVMKGDRIVAIAGKPTAKMDALAVRSAVNSHVRTGLLLDLISLDGKFKSVELREGAIYPLEGEDLALPQVRPSESRL